LTGIGFSQKIHAALKPQKLIVSKQGFDRHASKAKHQGRSEKMPWNGELHDK
jgi:hypothetical protein